MEQFTTKNGLSTNEVDIVTTGPEGMYAGYSDKSIAMYDGNTWIRDPLDIMTGIEGIDARPEELSILGVYPNPFNPLTTISYSINNPSHVRLSIYSITGQKVATLMNGLVSAGVQSATFDGSQFTSGVYFYRFESAGLNKSGKMLLLK